MAYVRFDWVRLSILASLGLAATGCGTDRALAGASGDSAGSGDGGSGDGSGDGGSASATATGDGGSGDDGTVPDLPTVENTCPDPEPIVVDGQYSGYVRCPDGTINRDAKVACTQVNMEPACQGTEEILNCTTDADCTDGPNGRCVSRFIQGGLGDYCGCVYSCESDGDCGNGEVCVCPNVVPTNAGGPQCAPATCLTNDDCASGECSISSYDTGCFVSVTLACRDPDDACRLDGDCGLAGLTCAATSDGLGGLEWNCVGPDCALGRPLLVGGRPRIADSTGRADWVGHGRSGAPRVPRDDARRHALATYWREVAALEHASVASFARFTLQLMALGAPAELLRDAQLAAADEVRHAELAYALASVYAQRELGPGPLEVRDVQLSVDPETVVRALVTEACVGETLGVAEALAAANATDDPYVREVSETIAADELRHAQLAWRTLQWILQTRPDLRAAAASAYEAAVAPLLDAAGSTDDPSDLDAPQRHPDLTRREQLDLRIAAVHELVAPTMKLLLA